jgi:hypothetical protein
VAFPKTLDGKELLGFGMNLLGLNTATLITRLGKRYGAANVQKAQGQLAVLQQAKGGLHRLNEFRSLDSQAKTGMLTAARGYAMETVAQQAVVWVSGFLATGGLGPVAKAAFSLVSTFLQNAQTFGQVGTGVLNSVQDIAAGQTAKAAQTVEQNLGRVTGLLMKFVSKLLGLDKIGGALRKGLTAVQKPINSAINVIVNSKPVQAVFRKLKTAGGAATPDTASNDIRTTAQKKAALTKAIKAGTTLLKAKQDTPTELDVKLEALRQHYQLKLLTVTEKSVGPLQVERQVYGEVNPTATGPAVVFTLPETWQGTHKNPINLHWPKPATATYPTIYLGGPGTANRKKYANSVLAGQVGQADPDVPGHTVKAYRPHKRVTLPTGETIGLAQPYRVGLGTVLHFNASLSSTTAGGRKFNSLAGRYGLAVGNSQFNADHVLERQLGGPDHLDNLWPLDGLTNSNGGRNLHLMTIDLGGGKTAKVTDLKNTSRKYFLKVVSTL